MMFLIGLLTAAMVLTCFVLIFLILLQLPKKEAGAGLAFGGAATDALFGAGSGTVLTQITKYLATLFFVLAVILSILNGVAGRRGKSNFQKLFSQPARAPAAAPAASTAPPAAAPTLPEAAATPGSNLLITAQSAQATNPAPMTATNQPPASATPTNQPPAPSTPK
jgi:preprotein translocase subunit SecG